MNSLRPLLAASLAALTLLATPALAPAQTLAPAATPAAAAAPSPTPPKRLRQKKTVVEPATSPAPAAAPAPGTPAVSPAPAKATQAQRKSAPTSKATSNTTPAAGGGPGMVWVNTKSHVYHNASSRWYGRTKAGKYLSEKDALAEGDHAAPHNE